MNIVVLTGAGISAESGLRTFRDNDGLWENHKIEDVATPEGFSRNPELVYDFYNQRRRQLTSGEAQPNDAHLALAKLERADGINMLIVTQNVDNLHEKAGSEHVIHMHGELLKAKCVQSGKSVEIEGDMDASTRCNCCKPAQAMRPDIVWFGEIPYHMQKIEEYLAKADIFMAIGTSGQVYPAAGFAEFAKACSAKTVELNLEASQIANIFDESYYGLATANVPEYIDKLLSTTEKSE